jgi:quercetin dioxygenase-like cupin family protein
MSKLRFLAYSHRLPWNATPFAGVSHKVLRIGEGASGAIDLTRIEKGAALPPHRHLVMQRAFFVSGIGEALDGTKLEAGSYAEVPPGDRHGTRAIEEVVILNFFDGRVSWILDDGEVFLLKGDGTYATLGKVAALGNHGLP